MTNYSTAINVICLYVAVHMQSQLRQEWCVRMHKGWDVLKASFISSATAHAYIILPNNIRLPWFNILTTKFLPSDVMIETVSVTQLRTFVKVLYNFSL